MRKWVKKHKKRLFAFILSLVLGVGSAFALSCPAFANSMEPPVWITVAYTAGSTSYTSSGYHSEGQNYSTYNTNQPGQQVYQGIDNFSYKDITFVINESFSFNPVSDYENQWAYYGFLQATGTVTVSVNPQTGTNMNFAELVSVNNTVPYSYKSDNSSFSYNISNNTVTINRNEIFYLSNDNFVVNSSSGPIYNRTTYTIRVWCYNTTPASPASFLLSGSYSGAWGRGSVCKYHSETYYLYNIDGKLNNITGLKDLFQGDDEILDIIEDSADVTEDRINTVDTVIASVAPDADQAIQNVSTVISDNGTFWSNQRNASLFWKEIISDMYDSTIMGYLGVGLSIVLIIILFVFILRL